MNGGRVGIANGIEGFTAIMAISRVDTFLFFFFAYFSADFDA